MGIYALLSGKLLKPARRRITLGLAGLLLGATALAAAETTHPLSRLSPELTDAEWQREATRIAREVHSAPEATLEPLAAPERQLVYRFRINRQPNAATLRLALAIPPQGLESARLLPNQEWRTTAPLSLDELTTAGVSISADLLGWVRNSRIERLSIPLQAMGNHERLKEGVIWLKVKPSPPAEDAAAQTAWAAEEKLGPLRETVRRLVANPDQVDEFAALTLAQVPGAMGPLPWTPVSPTAGGGSAALRLPISESGLYRLSGADLTSAGLAADTDPAQLHLMLEGERQPLLFLPAAGQPGARRGIAPDDSFVFRGLANESRFSATNSYWLVPDGTTATRALDAIPSPPPGAPAQKALAFSDKLVIEEDHPPVLTRNDQFLTILDYRWVWWTWTDRPSPALPKAQPLNAPGTVTFDLPGLSPEVKSLKAKAHFYVHSWPTTSGEVVVQARVNESAPVELRLASPRDEVKEFEVPAAALRPSGNKVLLTLAGAGTTSASAGTAAAKLTKMELSFDRLELEYLRDYSAAPDGLSFASPAVTTGPAMLGARRQLAYELTGVDPSREPVVFDVTETAPLQVKAEPVSGAPGKLSFLAAEMTTRSYVLRYLRDLPQPEVQSIGTQPDLRDRSNQADYLIIAHEDFLEEMKPFAEAKRGAGHAVALVDVRHVYDQFSAGQETPEALRSFLRHTVTTWQGSGAGPAASTVLLVGDCTSAYRGQFKNGVKNYVPTYSVSGWSESERYASDLWFAQVCGDDLLADSLIGRFSVNSVEDLRAILAKQADYALRAEPGPWRNTVAYVADHTEFESAVDRVMTESVPNAFFRKRVRMSDEPWTDNYYFPKEVADAKKAKVSPSTTAKIRDMFNEGAAMVTYFGHGSPNIWSTERIWFGGDSENSDNLMLNNKGKLPLIINMTCNSGAIDYPMPRWNVCISEDFMRVPEAGAVACYVPSGPGITAQHERLTLELNRALLEERVKPLSPALTLGSWRYLLAGNPPDLVRMFVLLGDPMLELDLPEANAPEGARLGDWLAGPTGSQVCEPVPAPALEGHMAQVVHQTEQSFAATEVMPLAQAPLTVQRDCPDGEKGCEGENCEGLVPRLRLTGSHADLAQGATAAFLGAGSQEKPFQAAAPVNAEPKVVLRSWKMEPAGLVQAGAEVRLTLNVENPGKWPLRAVRMSLKRAGKGTGEPISSEEALDLLPGESRAFSLRVRPEFGVNRLQVAAVTGLGNYPAEVETVDQVVVAAAPRAGEEAGKPAVMIDPASLVVRWSRTGTAPQALVRFKVYSVANYGANDLTAGLLSADGTILQDTITTLSAVAPGAPAQVELRRTWTGAEPPESEKMLVRLDPRATRADYSAAPPVEVTLGRSTMPDLLIPPGGVRPSSPTPTDGETVFFDVDLVNRGGTAAEGVKVTGYDGTTSASPRLESRVPPAEDPAALAPGQSRTIRVRWDPFQNAGQHEIRLVADSIDSPDQNPKDNEQVVPVRVLTKYNLKKGHATVLKPTDEDLQKRQIRVLARVYNQGESPAHGVRVIIYPDDKKNRNEVLGDVILDEVPAKSHRDAVITYSLKPGDEKRPFRPAFDAFLKGSLQRAPQAEESEAAPGGEAAAGVPQPAGSAAR